MSGAVASTSSSPAITVSSLTATTKEASTSKPTDVVTLTLVPRRRRARKEGVRWAEDVVDNEGQGKKSSKKCCIFHKRRVFGEWSDDEDSDAECDCQQ